MSTKIEHRAAPITGTADDGRTITARAVAYDVVDLYETRFKKGVFAESLREKPPVLAWAHMWEEPIGKIIAWDERDDGLYVTARLSDPEAVPRARQAISQLADGTLTDVSVGFSTLEKRTADDGVVDITKAEWMELSLVLKGAVPGAKVLSARGAMIDLAAAVELGRKVIAGELTQDEARATLALLDDGNEAPAAAADETPGEEPEQADTGAVDEALAGLDAALARSRR